MSKMTAAERNDLRSLIRQRARLMKTEVKQRRLELMSDFERQLSARFSYDQDETWKGAHALAEQAVNPRYRPKINQLRRTKDWRDLGAIKAELLDMTILERNAHAKRVVLDVKAQRKQRRTAR